jgi:hypothetical protein
MFVFIIPVVAPDPVPLLTGMLRREVLMRQGRQVVHLVTSEFLVTWQLQYLTAKNLVSLKLILKYKPLGRGLKFIIFVHCSEKWRFFIFVNISNGNCAEHSGIKAASIRNHGITNYKANF